MSGLSLLLSLLLSAVFGLGRPLVAPAAAAGPPPTGEVFAQDFPDPMVIHAQGAYYAYATQTAWERPGAVFPILRSTDLRNWSYVSDVFPQPPGWAVRDRWAPSVVERDGTYYAFYGASDGGDHCLAVATSASPEGPFQDRGMLSCGDQSGRGYIDPAVLLAGGGAYLYLSVDEPHHSISVQPLSGDLLHLAGPRRELLTVSQPWESGPGFATNEGPYPVVHGGRYYLFYSGNDWRHDYAMGVASSSSPTGPFVKSSANPVLHAGDGLAGPGGGSLFQAGGGRTTMLAYHAWTPAGRTLHLATVCWSGDGVRVGC